MRWAETTNNLGLAFTALGTANSDAQTLSEAVSAFDAALEERTRANAPALWADTIYNRARALRAQGRTADARSAALAALAAYEEVGNDRWVMEVRAFLARLSAP
jgi:tetratricopeptide (TPR) repeat protein